MLLGLLEAVAVGASAAMWCLPELLHGVPAMDRSTRGTALAVLAVFLSFAAALNALMWFAAIVPAYVPKDIISIMIRSAAITAVSVFLFLRSVRSRKV